MKRLVFKQYQFIYWFDQWVRRHLTPTGYLVGTFLIASAVFGVDTRQTNDYQLFVFLLVLLLFAILGSLYNRLHFSLTRELPHYGTVDEPLRYSITLHKHSTGTYDHLTLYECLNTNFSQTAELAQFYNLSAKPWYKRGISFRQWRDYVRYQRGGMIEALPLPTMKQDALTVTHNFIPLRRGVLHFKPAMIAKPDVLGLFCYLIPAGSAQNCIVLPKRYPIKTLNLPGKRKYQVGGVSLANSIGNSCEFMALRDYQQGDPLRAIHWKSYAKHGKLIVKDYQDEYFVRRALVLDTFVGNAPREQFEAAVSVAASLASGEHYTEALLDLLFVEQKSYCFTAGRGVDQLSHLQEILASVQASSESSFAMLAQMVLARIALCSSLVCVFMHWDEARQQFIRQLLAYDMPVAVFLLHDGRLTVADCANRPTHFYLLNYQRLAEQLANI